MAGTRLTSMLNITFVFVILSSLLLPCNASSIAANWTNPNANAPNYASTYINGERILVSWNPLNVSTNDLWLTRIDQQVDAFSLRIASSLDISTPGSYAWTIAVDDQEIALDTRFEFVFVRAGETYNATDPTDIQSPAFNLVLVNQVAPPNGTASGTVPAASATAAVIATPVASVTLVTSASVTSGLSLPTSSSSYSDDSYYDGNGLSTAAEVGIGIGALAFVGLLGSLFGLWLIKRRRARVRQEIIGEIKMEGPYETLGSTRQPTELGNKEAAVHEMDSVRSPSVYESLGTPVSELPSAAVSQRPGLHEMPG